MVGDITYIPTWQGWIYLALVIDCATRKIVGWAMDDNYKTPLIIDAIEMAVRNLNLPEGAVFHSDYAEVDVKPENLRMACSGRVG
jgi:putative transposase